MLRGKHGLKRKYHFIIIQNNEMGYINYKVTFSLGLGGHQHFLKIQNFINSHPEPSSPHDSTEYNSFALEILDILKKISTFPKEN